MSVSSMTPASANGRERMVGEVLRDDRGLSYEVLDVLGYGTYGSIYLAKTHTAQPGSASEYKAIKCLSKRGLTPAQLALQRQEIDIHLSLSSVSAKPGMSSPHIVDMSAVIETKDSLFLVMEYCSGGDLYDAIISQHSAAADSGVGFMAPTIPGGRGLDVHSDSSVLDAMAQIISAVAYSHSNGVFHRDLKPENILVSEDGTLKIADFGLATKDRLSSDFGCGSSFYMAPEQQHPQSSSAKSRRPYLPSKSDVWSLGIIFLNLRFGRNPWKLSRADSDDTFAAYARDSSVLDHMFPELSNEALHFLHRVLCVDPSERADCFEALELIQRMSSVIRKDNELYATASMENCGDDQTASDLSGAESSSMSSSGSSVFSSMDDDNESLQGSSLSGMVKEQSTHEMFQMDEDFEYESNKTTNKAIKNNNDEANQLKTQACLSDWSLASSGKSWSEMTEDEGEMDFSKPVDFYEATVAPNGDGDLMASSGFMKLSDLLALAPCSR
ncbi:hypothetical protein BGW38_009697 [Lunasporangiospora selenospora]|uniref:Protein kinase domain-containing protein n=1 Tax=Lunasporangiospora selenospora TaxID=979761 RepID=A0A9P6KG15_9FUNG|nr:hypothetical protein BGW38_009697 [Lunasporangiospora selenospora]